MDIPNTFNYMVGGYVVFAVVMLVYISSLVSRWNNLKLEQQMLEESEINSHK
ncbi:MAG: hypothetical protein NT121_18590 [Chloroflexi bacterium]|nr:hypothetical protein [Chloroflexota bacterium]